MAEPIEKKEEDIQGLDEEDETAVIKLKSKDGKLFPILRKAAEQSEFIKNALDTDKTATEISLFHIEDEIVQKVVEWLTYHAKTPPKPIQKPLQSTNMQELVDEWDAKFCDTDQDTMFKTLLAANYMDIKPLLMLMCAKVASLMKGKTPEQIRKTFNIRDDYTPEEEEQVRKQYRDLIE